MSEITTVEQQLWADIHNALVANLNSGPDTPRQLTNAAMAIVRPILNDLADANAGIDDLLDEQETLLASNQQLAAERDALAARIAAVRETIAAHRTSKGPAATVQVFRLEAALDTTTEETP